MANTTSTNERVTLAVRVMLAVHGERQQDIAGALGVDRSAITARMKGRTSWSLDDLDKLAQHWSTSVAALVDPALPVPAQGGLVAALPTARKVRHLSVAA